MKKILSFIVVLLSAFYFNLISAYDFTYDNLYYTVTSFNERTCKVVAGVGEYSGNIIIPNEVDYQGNIFQVTAIDNGAFYRSKSLVTVSIGDNVTSIGDKAFRECSSLKKVSIGKTVNKLGKYAFYDCTSLETIIIPPNVLYIELHAFSFSGLKNVFLLDGDSKIYCYTGSNYLGPFYGCALKNIYLGRDPYIDYRSNYTSDIISDISSPINQLWIGEYRTVFDPRKINDVTINEIYSRNRNPMTKINDFSHSQYLNTKLFVPYGCMEAYQASPLFGNFLNIDEFNAEFIEPDSLILNNRNLNLKEGERFQFDYKFEPPFANNITVNWKSLNTNVCSINSEGMLTALQTGDCTIIASLMSNPTIMATCDVHIFSEEILISSLKFLESEITIQKGEETKLLPVILPQNATNKKLSWHSTDNNIAIINQDGILTGKSIGSSYISIKSLDGSELSDICKINVSDNSLIETISSDSEEDLTIYTIDGMKLNDEKKLSKGIYIIQKNGKMKKFFIK